MGCNIIDGLVRETSSGMVPGVTTTIKALLSRASSMAMLAVVSAATAVTVMSSVALGTETV